MISNQLHEENFLYELRIAKMGLTRPQKHVEATAPMGCGAADIAFLREGNVPRFSPS